MAIEIINESTIRLTAGEHASLMREWRQACALNTRPPTFEDFVRARQKAQDRRTLTKGVQHE